MAARVYLVSDVNIVTKVIGGRLHLRRIVPFIGAGSYVLS